MVLSFGLMLLSGLFFAGCPAHTWDQLKDSDSVDHLRLFIQDNPRDPNLNDALKRIQLLDYRDAVSANTKFAYRMFLERHPDSIHSLEVKRRLEDIDFMLAQKDVGRLALLEYLHSWPNGRNAELVRAMIEKIDCNDHLTSHDPRAISKFIKLHKSISCRRDLDLRVEQLYFEKAIASPGAHRLVHFIENYPGGKLVAKARKILIARQVKALAAATRFGLALQLCQKAELETIDSLAAFVKAAHFNWIVASFDTAVINRNLSHFSKARASQLKDMAAKFKKNKGFYQRLAKATRIIRKPLFSLETDPQTTKDPARRWLEAEQVAFIPDEQAATILLDRYLSDPFIEVRLRSLTSLRQVMASLGEVRSETWIEQKIVELEKTAQAGSLLIKLAVLFDLRGSKDEALELLERFMATAIEPDLFSLYLAASLSYRLNKPKRVATLTKKLSQVAFHIYETRVEAWSTDKLGEGGQGWITLRRLYGVLTLWSQALSLFKTDESGHKKVPVFEPFLGAWSDKSFLDFSKASNWFKEHEIRWKQKHPAYRPCSEWSLNSAEQEKKFGSEKAAMFELAFSGSRFGLATLEWAACCHPRIETRDFTKLLINQTELIGSFTLFWKFMDLVPR
jgi:hypothetical protein